jgi:hypothetical protein
MAGVVITASPIQFGDRMRIRETEEPASSQMEEGSYSRSLGGGDRRTSWTAISEIIPVSGRHP